MNLLLVLIEPFCNAAADGLKRLSADFYKGASRGAESPEGGFSYLLRLFKRCFCNGLLIIEYRPAVFSDFTPIYIINSLLYFVDKVFKAAFFIQVSKNAFHAAEHV